MNESAKRSARVLRVSFVFAITLALIVPSTAGAIPGEASPVDGDASLPTRDLTDGDFNESEADILEPAPGTGALDADTGPEMDASTSNNNSAVSSPEASQTSARGIVLEGSEGTTYWGIGDDGTLYIKPLPGNATSKLSTPEGMRPGWWNRSEVRRLIVESGVEVPAWGSLHAAFADLPNLESADLRGLQTDWAEAMDYMLSNCPNLTTVEFPASFNVNNCKTMRGMFNACPKLASVDLSGLKHPVYIREMSHMFENCSSLKSLDLSMFNSASVESMYAAFQGCTSLVEVDLSGLDTRSAMDMRELFTGCSSLTRVKVGRNFNFAAVSTSGRRGYLVSNEGKPGTYSGEGLASTFTGKWFIEEQLLANPVTPIAYGTLHFPSTLQEAGWTGETAWLRAEMHVFVPDVPESAEWLRRVPGGNGGVKWEVTTNHVLHFYPSNGFYGTFSLDGGLSGWAMGHGMRITSAIVHDGVAVAEGGSANGMFRYCRKLASVDLTGLDVSKASGADSLFEGGIPLVSVKVGQGFSFSDNGLPGYTGPAPDRGDGVQREFTGEWYLEEQMAANPEATTIYLAENVPSTLAQAGWFDGPATWRAFEQEVFPDDAVSPVTQPDGDDEASADAQPDARVLPLPVVETDAESGSVQAEVVERGGAQHLAAQAADSVQLTVAVTLVPSLLVDAEGHANPNAMKIANEGDHAVRLVGLTLALANENLPGGSWTVTAEAVGGPGSAKLLSAAAFQVPGSAPYALPDGPVVDPGASASLRWDGFFGDEANRLAKLAREAGGLLKYGTLVPVVCAEESA